MDFTLYHDLDAAGPHWLDDLFAWLATYLPAVIVAGAVLLVLAAIVSFARVYAGTHYPSDVVAGGAIGAGVALLLRVPPVRRGLERFAQLCSTIWDRLLGVVYRPRTMER